MCLFMSVPLEARRALRPLELQLQEVVNCPAWVMGAVTALLKEQKVFLTTEISLQPQLISSLSKIKYLIIFKNSIHEQNIFSSHLPLTFPFNSPGIHYSTPPNSCSPPPFFKPSDSSLCCPCNHRYCGYGVIR